jgi:hypothetical protein
MQGHEAIQVVCALGCSSHAGEIAAMLAHAANIAMLGPDQATPSCCRNPPARLLSLGGPRHVRAADAWCHLLFNSTSAPTHNVHIHARDVCQCSTSSRQCPPASHQPPRDDSWNHHYLSVHCSNRRRPPTMGPTQRPAVGMGRLLCAAGGDYELHG